MEDCSDIPVYNSKNLYTNTVGWYNQATVELVF